MSTAHKPYTTPIQRTALGLAAKRLAQKLSVFVAGPLIDKTWTSADLDSRPASKLRLHIKDFVETQLQHHVIFGEHRGVSELGQEQFGSQASFALTEMALVEDSHAIVIVPASAGSFCELGAWSAQERICPRLLIIADKKFESDESYLRLGTLQMAINQGATVAWHDYNDLKGAEALVQKFVHRAHDKLMARLVTRGE